MSILSLSKDNRFFDLTKIESLRQAQTDTAKDLTNLKVGDVASTLTIYPN